MALDLNTTQQRMEGARNLLGGYTSELPGQINQEIQKAWSPALEEASGVVGKKLTNLLPDYFDIPESGMMQGTSGASVSPQFKLQQMGLGLGQLGGGLAQASTYADTLGANMNDVYGKALDSMRFGYQTASDSYNRALQEYQLAQAAAEAERQRQEAAAARAAQAAAMQLQQAQIEQSLGGGIGEDVTPIVPRDDLTVQDALRFKQYQKDPGSVITGYEGDSDGMSDLEAFFEGIGPSTERLKPAAQYALMGPAAPAVGLYNLYNRFF